jgi:hypothetical protein
VVRERSAKPLYVGSIPTRASNLFKSLHLTPDEAHSPSVGSFVGIPCILPLFALLGACCLPLKFSDLLDRVEGFQLFHSLRLVLLGGVSIAKHHLDSGMAQHGRQRHKVNAGHRRSSGPCVTEVVEARRSDAAGLHSAVMGVVHLWNGPCWV